MEDFLQEQFWQSPLIQEQILIKLLILSFAGSSCHRGTSAPSSCSIHPHSIGVGKFTSITLSFQTYPACKHARFICCKIPESDGTSIRRLKCRLYV